MKRLIKYTSIGQFRSVIKAVQHSARFAGVDANGNPIYNSARMPVITAVGTEKIHGCLKYDTLISTKEYGDIPIKEIVDNKLVCSVMTYNTETKQNEWNNVLNEWKSPPSKRWMKVTLEDNSEIILTEDHELFNPITDSYKSAKEFKIGDILLKR